MLHQWLGGEVLRAGLHLYLTRHKGTSANTADLWAALQVLVPVGGDGDDGCAGGKRAAGGEADGGLDQGPGVPTGHRGPAGGGSGGA